MIQYSNVHNNRKLMSDRLFNFSINKKKRQFKIKKDRIKKNRRLGLIRW